MKKLNNPSKKQPRRKGQPIQAAPKSLETTQPEEAINEELSQGLMQVLQTLPKEKQVKIRHEIHTLIKSHSGPLPAAETLQEYENTMSGAANRVFLMAEKEQDDRIGKGNTIIRRQLNQSSTGQWMAFILALLFLGAGVFLGYNGHDWLAGTIVGTTLLGLVAVFITGKYKEEKSEKVD